MADPYTIAGSAGLGFFDAWYNNRSAMDRQHDAQDFSAEQFSKRYQTTVKDLIAAGLNPMLAYMHGPGSSPSGTVASPGGKGMDLVGAVNTTRLASAQEGATRAMEVKTLQDAKTSHAQEKNINVDTLVKSGMPAYYAALVDQATSSAESASAMAQKIRAEIPMVEYQIKELKARAAKETSDVKLNQSLIEANNFLNMLRLAEQHLTESRKTFTDMESRVLHPKAKAAGTWSAERAAETELWGTMGKNTWKLFNPFHFGN